MKLKKQQLMILAVVLVLVISVTVVVFVLNSTDAPSPNENGDVNETGDWIDLSSNIKAVATDSEFGAPDLTDVFFINENEGWVTTDTVSEIYHTIDGGETWEVQTTPLGATVAIHMLDENNGYAGGDGGWIYVTENGGDDWNALGSMGTTLDISFPPNTTPANPTGYACGDSGNVWEITDTITNRNSLSASTFRGISAPSINNVWVCGGGSVFYHSENSFAGQIVPSGTFNDIHFINENEGWLVGTAGIIVHTTDGGSTWNEQINPDPQKKTLIKVIFLDADNGWAVGAYGTILHTTDGGSNWVIMETNVSSLHLTGIHFTSPTNGYIVGNNGTLLKYTEEN